MIVVTVFLSISSQIEFHFVQNRKENCHHDHIPFNLKGNGTRVFSMHDGKGIHQKIGAPDKTVA